MLLSERIAWGELSMELEVRRLFGIERAIEHELL